MTVGDKGDHGSHDEENVCTSGCNHCRESEDPLCTVHVGEIWAIFIFNMPYLNFERHFICICIFEPF